MTFICLQFMPYVHLLQVVRLYFIKCIEQNLSQNIMFRKQANSSKWEGKTEGEMYPLTLADMDFPLYKPFKQKFTEQIQNLNNLTYKNRSSRYFQAIIDWYRSHHLSKYSKDTLNKQVQLLPQHFIQCPSICNLVGCCILAFSNQRQNVMIFTPVYSFYLSAIGQLNRNLVCCQLRESQTTRQLGSSSETQNHISYKLDLKDFQTKMTLYRPKLIILCHPHNPTGKVFEKEEVDFIIRKASQNSTYILSDEIMGDFCLYPQNKKKSPQFYSLVNYQYQRIIVGNSISKVFNCQSVQGGYGIIRSKQVRDKYNKIGNKAFKHLTNQIALILTPIIYSVNGQSWIKTINRVIQENFVLLKNTFSQQKNIKIFELQSSYLTTVEFDFAVKAGNTSSDRRIINNKQFSEVLAKYQIYFVDMQNYFYPTSNINIFRVAIAIPPEQFKKFVKKFKECVDYLRTSLIYNQKTQLKPKL